MSVKNQNDPQAMLVEKAADGLMEHFDSVAVFVTGNGGDGESTAQWVCTRGNFYARMGQIRDWIVRQDERTRIFTRRDEEDSIP